MAQVIISFQQYFTLATKQDWCLLAVDLHIVYNLWCYQWIVMAADDMQSTIFYVIIRIGSNLTWKASPVIHAMIL